MTLPPGQQLVAQDKWPVIGERQPRRDDSPWRIEFTGRLARPMMLTLEELQSWPPITRTVDLHCVTRWSKLGLTFRGVRLLDLVEHCGPLADAAYISFTARSERNHSSSLRWDDCQALDPLVALEADGQPLTSPHGGPVRVVVPGRYFYKSVKWLERVTLLAEDQLGFWEATAGYHNTADPWQEQRYVASGLSKSEVQRLLVSKDFRGRDLTSLAVAEHALDGLLAAEAILRNADVRRCRLEQADFRGANLSNAKLDGAHLVAARFDEADLEGASLVGADLRRAVFTGASLFGATLADGPDQAIVDASTRFDPAALDQLTPDQSQWLAQRLAGDES